MKTKDVGTDSVNGVDFEGGIDFFRSLLLKYADLIHIYRAVTEEHIAGGAPSQFSIIDNDTITEAATDLQKHFEKNDTYYFMQLAKRTRAEQDLGEAAAVVLSLACQLFDKACELHLEDTDFLSKNALKQSRLRIRTHPGSEKDIRSTAPYNGKNQMAQRLDSI